MKHLFYLLVSIILFSCNEEPKELPPHLRQKVMDVNISTSILDELTDSLKTINIKSLSNDTRRDLMRKYQVNYQIWNESNQELKSLLDINPEYSSYDEIKNMNVPKSFLKDFDTLQSILDELESK